LGREGGKEIRECRHRTGLHAVSESVLMETDISGHRPNGGHYTLCEPFKKLVFSGILWL
jgi:hypothetical protein